MPRQPRQDLAGVPQHVVQRGNDRHACFFREGDYARYLGDLKEASLAQGCDIHAYVLMTNHVHLLVTPGAAGAVARMMQAVGRRYVRYVNNAIGRTGTLWEGRYKSSLIDTEHYLLACYRYIELNPVRAHMVARAEDYRWSSHAANALGLPDALVRPHAVFLSIAGDPEVRRRLYREFVGRGTAEEELAALRLHSQRQRALGSRRFEAQIEQQLGRRAGIGKPGRPPRTAVDEKVL